jgi:hypothetical protein
LGNNFQFLGIKNHHCLQRNQAESQFLDTLALPASATCVASELFFYVSGYIPDVNELKQFKRAPLHTLSIFSVLISEVPRKGVALLFDWKRV